MDELLNSKGGVIMRLVKILVALSVVCSLSLLTGCWSSSPGDVAKAFSENFFRGNFDAASQYAVKVDVPRLKDTGFKNSMAKTLQSIETIKEVVPLSAKEIGDTATVRMKLVLSNGHSEESDIPLVKEDGKWKVHILPDN